MLLTYGDVLCYVSGGLCEQPITQEQRWRRPIAALEGQALRFETAIDNIPQGVCFFDGDQKLIPCNRRYNGNLPDRAPLLHPGLTLGEIVELREVAGTSAMPGDASEARVAPAASRDVGKPKAPGCTSAKAQWQRHTQPGVQRSDTDCRDGRKPAHRPR